MRLADKSQTLRVGAVQLAATTAASALLLIFFGSTHAYSGFAGGAIAVAGSAWFSLRVFVHYRAQEPGRLLARFYRGELEKLLVTALLFAGAIVLIDPLSAGALFGVFLLVQFVPMLAAPIIY